jgi:hypothetical protein
MHLVLDKPVLVEVVKDVSPMMKEQEEERDVNAFGGETIGVAGVVALQQPVAFELAQVV